MTNINCTLLWAKIWILFLCIASRDETNEPKGSKSQIEMDYCFQVKNGVHMVDSWLLPLFLEPYIENGPHYVIGNLVSIN